MIKYFSKFIIKKKNLLNIRNFLESMFQTEHKTNTCKNFKLNFEHRSLLLKYYFDTF